MRKSTKSTRPYTRQYQSDRNKLEQRESAHTRGAHTASRKQGSARVKSSVAWFNSPVKRLTLLIVGCLLALGVMAFAGDIMVTGDTIHAGVKVEGVDLGGMIKDDAKVALNTALADKLLSQPVALFANDAAKAKGVTKKTAEISTGVESYLTKSESDAKTKSWTVSADAVGANVDVDKTVDEAYAVGRGVDLLLGRLLLLFGEVDLNAQVLFDANQMLALNNVINTAIGVPAKNANVKFNSSSFEVTGGTDGSVIVADSFEEALALAFLSTERSLVIPMATVAADVTPEMAKPVAADLDDAIKMPITLNYEGKSVELTSVSLGEWITADAKQDADGNWQLIASVSNKKLKDGLPPLVSDFRAGQAAKDASFKLNGDKIKIVKSKNGLGVDYDKLTTDINAILFSDDADVRANRTVVVGVNVLTPKFSTADAEALHITEKIASYSTYYGDSTEARATNIAAAAKLLDCSMIAPGATWSFTGLTGDSTADKGFVVGTAIGANNEIIDAIGGGICQVATTVFNAAFDSGLPIVERNNHSMYMSMYPDGRDAAIAYPSMDLKFSNDTPNSMLLTLAYNGAYLTATLWGTDPGYSVKYEKTAWKTAQKYETKEVDDPKLTKGKKKVETEGVNGKTITVTRWVYDKDGNLLREAAFRSTYQPVDELVKIGTKEPKEPKEPKAPTKPEEVAIKES